MRKTRLSGVRDYRVEGREIELVCEIDIYDEEITAYDASLPSPTVTLRFHNPSTFEFLMNPIPSKSRSGSPLRIERDAITEPVDVSVNEMEDELQVLTERLELIIGLDCWSLTVFDREGGEILSTDESVTNSKGEYLVDPTGYTERRRANWPLKVDEIGISLRLGADEGIYGFGEAFTDVNRRGQTISSRVRQAKGSGGHDAYKTTPFYLSSKGYGAFVNTSCDVTLDAGDTLTSTLRLTVSEDIFRLFVFADGTPLDSIEEYTALTGRPRLPPKWSFGIWMSRNTYRSWDEVVSIADRLRDEGVPADVIHIDPGWQMDDSYLDWDTGFDEPRERLSELKDDGFHISLWEWPYVTPRKDEFERFDEKGFFIKDASGDSYLFSRLSAGAVGGIIDFTNPEARQWYRKRHVELLDDGVDVFKLDFGEYVPDDSIFHDGSSGKHMHNIYPMIYHQTVLEAYDETGKEPVLWSRAGWTGNQRYPIHWGGDPESSFSGLSDSLKGGLNLSASGYAFWTSDIGGYKMRPSPNVYVRWAQANLVGTSHARFHGKTPREPWEYGEEALEIVRKFAILRYRLLPYIYASAETATRTGHPVMCPLFLEYPDDLAVRNIDSEHLLGKDILVSPVLNADGETSTYLPGEDNWFDFWTGEAYDGGQTITEMVPLDLMPIFLREESVIPMDAEPGDQVTEGLPEHIELHVAPCVEGATQAVGQLYDDREDQQHQVVVSMDDRKEQVEIDLSESITLDAITLVLYSVDRSIDVNLIGQDAGEISISECNRGVQIDVDVV